MGKGKSCAEKDLFHGQGNSTVSLPKGIMGGKKLTNPYATPGVKQPHKKTTQKGWNK